MNAVDIAKDLTSRGYRIVSRSGRIVSRVDRPDWKEYLKENRMPVDADWYRRCVSEDSKVISHSLMKYMMSSCNDNTGFVKEIK